ncbi:hypothetical protein C5167_006061 [Papaver somniferum]|uniref:DNA repair metallo-beta-lactamase domain-containing protein n=1 Tax=Papaver somniferum TaxID=3469 RepID=A0A4Y7JG83_PAPSO|nr:hypothetical protein C5167_006061 [Papaver somniferum]
MATAPSKAKKNSPRRWFKQGTTFRYEVPYNEHCSFTELREFVKFISQQHIIPSVNNNDRLKGLYPPVRNGICRLQILKMVNGILNIFKKKTAPKEVLRENKREMSTARGY